MNTINRRNNSSMKWDYQYIKKRFDIDIDDNSIFYPMFIADMDYQMDNTIKNKLHNLLEEPDLGYFLIQNSFYDSIINWYKNIHHINIEKEWIVPSIGTISSLHLACDMIANNKEILIMTPIYGPFLNCAKIGTPVLFPLQLDNNNYLIDFNKLEDTIKNHNISALLLCNPHNPGGKVWSNDELMHLVLLCKKYNITILSDEIHGDFMLTDKKYTSLVEFKDIYDSIIVSSSPNKTFNISGLSTSFILCPNRQLKNKYETYMNKLHISPNRLGINMIEYVYTYGKDWYLHILENIKKNVNIIINEAKEAGCEVMIPEGGFLVWIHLSKISNVNEFILNLAKHTHVLLETGSRFVDNYDGWVRINAATDTNAVVEAMKKFKEYYKNY